MSSPATTAPAEDAAPAAAAIPPNPSLLDKSLPALTLAALGVVYGDIGTSPLYAVKETFNPDHGIPLSAANILGGLSAIFWALMIVVSLKYVILIMRADNKGEGGIMALLALASSAVKDRPKWRRVIMLLGVFGASLFYGDAVLTPAISVLSAVEGLEVGTTAFKPYVVPIAVGVVIALFALQRKGTSVIGVLFGPITVLWFLAIAALGLVAIAANPQVLQALDPRYAIYFVTGHGVASFVVLGAVLLAFTGAEALYADMGHFGKTPIRLAWFGLVFPALVLNYFGQGALLIADQKAIENPFFLLAPVWALYPMVALATAATVVASQATISGTYSLTKQAIQLDYLPRLAVLQTSAKEIGQIYIPGANWVLLLVIVAVVAGFGSSSRLASAYGVAVTGTMLVTTFLTFFVIRFGWGYPLALCIAATGSFMIVDAGFFSSALVKIADGGWFPISLGAIVFMFMTTWRTGREIVAVAHKRDAIPIVPFLASLLWDPPHRVPGTAVFMAGDPDSVPHALLHNLAHNKVLHERVVFLTVIVRNVPWVPTAERVSVEPLENGFFRLRVAFGFMDRPDVSQTLDLCKACGFEFHLLETSFFLSRSTVIPTPGTGMMLWREKLFAAMARNARTAADYYNIPTDRVIELGTKIVI
ncbi:MAG TPA: potassium transporter Kup [Burkholderiales bacterium]|nr:potassium transporter Kup [Burkholderiales bacterium]